MFVRFPGGYQISKFQFVDTSLFSRETNDFNIDDCLFPGGKVQQDSQGIDQSYSYFYGIMSL